MMTNKSELKANTNYYDDGKTIKSIVKQIEIFDECHTKGGKKIAIPRVYKHCEDGPAYLGFHENGKPHSITFYINDAVHRTDGPAMATFYENGNRKEERWYIDGKISCLQGPSKIKYDEQGIKVSEEWLSDEHRGLHREDGPALIQYNPDGSIKSETWYIKGSKDKGLEAKAHHEEKRLIEHRNHLLAQQVEQTQVANNELAVAVQEATTDLRQSIEAKLKHKPPFSL